MYHLDSNKGIRGYIFVAHPVHNIHSFTRVVLWLISEKSKPKSQSARDQGPRGGDRGAMFGGASQAVAVAPGTVGHFGLIKFRV